MRILLLAFLTGLFFAIPDTCFSQKVEKERRVDREILPAPMLAHLRDLFPERRRVRYYLEENEAGTFYEAKFRHQQYYYSVKYYLDGRLLDIERQIKFKAVPPLIRQKVKEALSERLNRFKIVKVQEQIKRNEVDGYEIEIRGKSSEHFGYFEAHFSAEGGFEDIQTIEERPNDFLFF